MKLCAAVVCTTLTTTLAACGAPRHAAPLRAAAEPVAPRPIAAEPVAAEPIAAEPIAPPRATPPEPWPEAPGIEITHAYDDGTRAVRALGYLDSYSSTPGQRLSLATDAYAYAELSGSAAVVAELRAASRVGRGAFTGPNGSMLDEQRARTLIPAIGTCGAHTWVTGVAVVVVGRATLLAKTELGYAPELRIAVERVEAVIPTSRWLTVAPRYAQAVARVTRAVSKRRALAPEDGATIERAQNEIRAAFGAGVAPLLEVDRLLSALRAAIAAGSVSGARAALRARCHRTTEEWALDDALDKL
ncbi:MAG: hypothetical protein KC657_22845 [Myxococcales bacterium]|nr:hypothetical protein [Myxococcales bacterium]